jgi:hypothetical protein
MSHDALLPRYSGPLSVLFWRRVRRLPARKVMKAYAIGCALQELEVKVLALVNQPETPPRKTRKKAQ